MKTKLNSISFISSVIAFVAFTSFPPQAVYAMRIFPQKRENIVSSDTFQKANQENNATVHKVVEGEKQQQVPVSVNVKGENNNISVQPPPASTNAPAYRENITAQAGSKLNAAREDNFDSKEKVTIPLGVALILLAIGIMLLVAAIGMVFKYSRSAKAAYGLFDNKLAAWIQELENKIKIETDQTRLTHLNAELSELEKERGKLNNRS